MSTFAHPRSTLRIRSVERGKTMAQPDSIKLVDCKRAYATLGTSRTAHQPRTGPPSRIG
jgi:hypothetical protein